MSYRDRVSGEHGRNVVVADHVIWHPSCARALGPSSRKLQYSSDSWYTEHTTKDCFRTQVGIPALQRDSPHPQVVTVTIYVRIGGFEDVHIRACAYTCTHVSHLMCYGHLVFDVKS